MTNTGWILMVIMVWGITAGIVSVANENADKLLSGEQLGFALLAENERVVGALLEAPDWKW